MRRISLVLCSILISAIGYSQTCISDQNITDVGFHPKTIEPAYVDSIYKQVLQVRIFKDTSVLLNGNPVFATIDSIVVTGIEGLPTGFYYTCAHKNCTFIPDSTGCATLEGTAIKSDVGNHPIDIQIVIYAKIFGTVSTTQKDTIRQFTMTVDDLNSVGDLDLQQVYLYPNPSRNGNIYVSNKLLDDVESVICLNPIGQVVDYKINNGKISLKNSSAGLYTILLTMTSGKTISQRVLFTD
ncbi:MAG: hypothetical protein ACI9JN_000041 [Bacteroidia bacterium]|jgi:hypothetical protein